MAWTFKEWYRQNASALNQARKKRYHEDDEYRKKILERNREGGEKHREERRKKRIAEKKAIKVKRPKTLRGTWVEVNVGGEKKRIKVFSLGALATALGKSPRTLYKWEKEGLLPDTPFRTKYGARLYSVEMMEWIRSQMESLGKVSSDPRVRRGTGEHRGAIKIVEKANGERMRVRLFRLGMVARAVGKTRETLLQWERQGIVPVTPFRASELGHRLYTVSMIESLVEALQDEGGVVRGGEAKERLKKRVFEAWSDVLGSRIVDLTVIS